MNTQLSSKLLALGVSLVINCAMIGGVAYLFSGEIHQTAMVQAVTLNSAAAAAA
jgi:hypothetical protein